MKKIKKFFKKLWNKIVGNFKGGYYESENESRCKRCGR